MDAFVGEIRVFAGNYPPVNWVLCNGQVFPIQQFNLLYSVIGARYGGDGRTTFAVPNLMGRVPVGLGQGPGLTDRLVGEAGGVAQVTLLQSELPPHNHPANSQSVSNQTTPVNDIWANGGARTARTYNTSAPSTPMNPLSVAPFGGSQPHQNMQPYLAMNFIIATYGEYPVKSS